MQTLRQDVLDRYAFANRCRMTRLRKLDAPKMMVEYCEKRVLNPGAFVKFEEGFDFDVEFSRVEDKKGRGGKPFLRYSLPDGKQVGFYPNAKFGPFVSYITK